MAEKKEDYEMTISERIFERLKQLSMTQKEFAETVGVRPIKYYLEEFDGKRIWGNFVENQLIRVYTIIELEK